MSRAGTRSFERAQVETQNYDRRNRRDLVRTVAMCPGPALKERGRQQRHRSGAARGSGCAPSSRMRTVFAPFAWSFTRGRTRISRIQRWHPCWLHRRKAHETRKRDRLWSATVNSKCRGGTRLGVATIRGWHAVAKRLHGRRSTGMMRSERHGPQGAF